MYFQLFSTCIQLLFTCKHESLPQQDYFFLSAVPAFISKKNKYPKFKIPFPEHIPLNYC